jgi:hypothetical protein
MMVSITMSQGGSLSNGQEKCSRLESGLEDL